MSRSGGGKVSPGSAWHYTSRSGNSLTYAVEVGEYVATNVATKVENANPKKTPQQRAKVEVFTLDEIFGDRRRDAARVAGAADPRGGDGPPAGGLFALTSDDLHLRATPPFASVSKAYSDGELKETKVKKTWAVPLRAFVVEALAEHPRRLDTNLVFYALWKQRRRKNGTRHAHPWIDLGKFYDYWYPALEGAGLRRRTPYAMRHTYASRSIAAGIPVFQIAERMGTSVEQIRDTYGHLIQGADEWEVEQLDAFDSRPHATDAVSVAIGAPS